MLVDTWRVADDAEAHKRHLLEVAHLSDGGTLHVHCQTIGELHFDICQNRVIGDKLIASANQPCVDFRLNRSIFHHLSRHRQERLSAGKASRQPLHLTIEVAFTAPHIVIGGFSTHHDIHHPQFCIDAASTSRIDDGFRGKTCDELRSAYGSIDLANATLHEHNLVMG